MSSFRFSWICPLLFTVLSSILGCGIKLGSSTANDPPPVGGQVVAQGTFSGLNGQTMTGQAEIYFMSTGSYIMRLDGILAPNEPGLQIIGVVDGTNLSPLALRSLRGNQNYSVSFQDGNASPTWSKVRIYQPATNFDVAAALLVGP